MKLILSKKHFRQSQGFSFALLAEIESEEARRLAEIFYCYMLKI